MQRAEFPHFGFRYGLGFSHHHTSHHESSAYINPCTAFDYGWNHWFALLCRVGTRGLLLHVALRASAHFRVRPPLAGSGSSSGGMASPPLRRSALFPTAPPVSSISPSAASLADL